MRKKLLSLFAGLLISAGLFAQPANDDCSTAQNIGTLPTPSACPSGSGAAVNINGTLVGATPMNPYTYMPNCTGTATVTANPANDVWYSFTASGYQAVITINSTFSDPNIAMYSGTCGALGGGVGGCAVGSGGTVTLTVEQMVIGTTYMIQVSSTSTGTFTMSIRNNIDCNNCLTSATLTANPPPVNGSYQPGQTVNFCYKINNYQEVNTNWMHGVQLTLGSGWNTASIVASPATSWGGDGTWNYYPAGITDAQGNVWPRGWYFDRANAPLGGGTASDGNPGNNFGDEIENATGAVPGGVWNFCFSVQVASACNPGSNLSVAFNTSGDGESGTWTNLACVGDPPTVANAVGSCCPPTMTSTPATCINNDGTATATPAGASGPYTYSWSGPSGYSNTSTNVAGANTISGLPAGTYSVTITDASLCAVTGTVTVGGNPVVPTAPTTTPVSYCLNATAVSLTATPSAGGTLNWYGTNSTGGTASATAPTPTTSPAGNTTYYVSQTISGCEGPRAPLVVTVNPLPTPVVNSNSPVCVGATINLTASGGTGYAWTGPNAFASATQNPSITNATAAMAGTYSVTVTDANNCQAQGTTVVVVNPLPTPVVNSNSPVCVGATINLTASGGTGYAWTGPNAFASATQNPSITNATAAMAGTYSVTVTDANNCQAQGTTVVVVNPLPTPVVNSNSPVCAGATINLTASGGTGYAWTGPNAFASATQNPSITNATTAMAGTYSVTVTDANNCQAQGTTVVVVNPLPTPVVNSNSPVCVGATINLTASGGTGYAWTGPNAFASATQNPSITNATAAMAGTYSVTVTDANNCQAQGTTVVVVNPLPTPVVNSNSPVCAGATINLTASGGTGYAWTGPNAFASATQNPSITNATAAMAGTYSVTVTDANNCQAQGTTVVVVNPLPTPVVNSNSPVCVGATINLTASGGTGYSWTGPNAFASATQNPSITNATAAMAGTYSVTVTDANSCQAQGTTVVVVNPLPVPTANSVPIPTYCVNESFTLQASPNGMTSYQWSGPLSFASNQQNPTATLISVPMSGTYTLTVTDANGCQAQATTSITVNALPTTTIGSNGPVCEGNTLNLNATGGVNYSWQGPGGYTSNAQNPSITSMTLSQAGNYSVIVTDGNGCSSPNFIAVVVNTNPTPLPSASPACLGTQLDLTVSPSFANYSWTGPNAFASALQSPSISPVTNAAQGTYSISVTDANGCVGTNTVSTTVYPLPTATTNTIAPGCAPVCRDFFISGTNLVNFSWDLGNGNFSGNDTLLGHCYYTPGTYDVIVTITDNNGCVNTVNFPSFTVFEVPRAEFNFGPKEVTILEPLVNFTDLSTGSNIVSWNWEFGDPLNSTSSEQHPSYTYPEVGSYDVQLVVTTLNGCIDTVVHTVYIPEDWAIYVPTAFSPNEDGVNDYFFPKGVGIDEKRFKMWIFDRWGNQLFYTEDWNGRWDGKVQGHSNMVQEDVYIWKIIAQSFKGDKFNEVGHVTVVK